MSSRSETSAPISALRAERERRKAKDREYEDLRAELQKYDDQKLGIDEELLRDEYAQYARDADPDRDAAVENYEKSFNSFKTVHGEQRVAAIDAALKRLTPEQQQEVSSLVGSHGDPVKNIEAYVQRLGLLDPKFQKLSLADVLAGKKQPEASPEMAQIDQRLAEMTKREQAIHIAEGRAQHAASRAEFIADYGRAAFDELDAVAAQLVQSNHPAVPQITAAMQKSASPVHTAAEMLMQLGWQPSQTQQRQQQPAVMPSNFASTRSVTQRRGPAWSGPASLNDIFDRRRA